jgi:hypothetical protein
MERAKVLKIVGYVVAGVLVALMGFGKMTYDQAMTALAALAWLMPSLAGEVKAVLPKTKGGAQ